MTEPEEIPPKASVWRSIDTDAPDWQDEGPIEVRRSDGTTVGGHLMNVEIGFDGEAEYPIWAVRLDDGIETSLFDYKEWRSFIR